MSRVLEECMVAFVVFSMKKTIISLDLDDQWRSRGI